MLRSLAPELCASSMNLPAKEWASPSEKKRASPARGAGTGETFYRRYPRTAGTAGRPYRRYPRTAGTARRPYRRYRRRRSAPAELSVRVLYLYLVCPGQVGPGRSGGRLADISPRSEINEGERLPRHPRADRMVATRDIKMIVLPRPASKRPRAPLTSHVYTLRAHGASDGARGRGWRPGAEGLKSLNFWRLTSSRVGTGCVSWRWLRVS